MTRDLKYKEVEPFGQHSTPMPSPASRLFTQLVSSLSLYPMVLEALEDDSAVPHLTTCLANSRKIVFAIVSYALRRLHSFVN